MADSFLNCVPGVRAVPGALFIAFSIPHLATLHVQIHPLQGFLRLAPESPLIESHGVMFDIPDSGLDFYIDNAFALY
jgi:hypothetical protein